VVPTDALEAKALVGEMEALGVKRLYIKTDGGDYGAALKHAVTSDASSAITLVSSPSSADAVLYAGGSVANAAATLNQAVSSNPSVKLFAPSALAQNSFAGALSPAAQGNVYVSSPGFGASDLTSEGQQFVSAFRSAYGHDPGPQAIFGYEAMAAVLAVLKEAGGAAGNRSLVVSDFRSIKDRNSVLGTYSIQNGDTTIAPFIFAQYRKGALAPLP
jgi:branched-chain amino acid transport system substrate-binding protein